MRWGIAFSGTRACAADAAMLARLLDEWTWGLLSGEETRGAVSGIVRRMPVGEDERKMLEDALAR